MDKEHIIKIREFIALVIRVWRSNMVLMGVYRSDKHLAKLVRITPSAFSRLANGTTTATLPVYRALMVAISDSVGSDVRNHIIKDCYSAVFGD